MDMSLKEKAKKIFDPLMWGLRLKAINDLGKRLKSFWERYSFFFKTKASDNRHYGYKYISCLLRMECDRNYASIGRASGVNKQNGLSISLKLLFHDGSSGFAAPPTMPRYVIGLI